MILLKPKICLTSTNDVPRYLFKNRAFVKYSKQAMRVSNHNLYRGSAEYKDAIT